MLPGNQPVKFIDKDISNIIPLQTVSLILTCHNQHVYLQQLIQLLEKFLDMEKDVEVIVADSTKEEIKLPPFVHYYRIPNNGPSAARNFGVSKAKGTWVLFCDADDLVNPFTIRNISTFAEQQPETDAFFFNFRQEEDGRVVTAAEKYYDDFEQPAELKFQTISEPGYFLQNFFPVHAALFRRSVFDQTKFHEPQWFIEDVRLYIEMALIPGIRMRYCNDAAFHSFHRFFKNRESLSSSNPEAYWKSVCSNYDFLVANKKQGFSGKLQLVKLVVINFHVVSHEMKPLLAASNKIIWDYFFGLPRLIKNRILYKAVVLLYNIIK